MKILLLMIAPKDGNLISVDKRQSGRHIFLSSFLPRAVLKVDNSQEEFHDIIDFSRGGMALDGISSFCEGQTGEVAWCIDFQDETIFLPVGSFRVNRTWYNPNATGLSLEFMEMDQEWLQIVPQQNHIN